ncbi:hypothetical protein U1Q18_004515 [Sarracenia purpurea var. burkii]
MISNRNEARSRLTSPSPTKKRNCRGDYPVVMAHKASRQRTRRVRGNLPTIHGVVSSSRRSAKSDGTKSGEQKRCVSFSQTQWLRCKQLASLLQKIEDA